MDHGGRLRARHRRAAAVDRRPPSDGEDAYAALCLRTGYLSLRRIAEYFGLPFDPDPLPTDPISVSRREFDLMCFELIAADVPIKEDRDRAWQDFQGWRVNYDAVLVGLAKMIMAPEGRWSSDRPGPRLMPGLRLRKGGPNAKVRARAT